MELLLLVRYMARVADVVDFEVVIVAQDRCRLINGLNQCEHVLDEDYFGALSTLVVTAALEFAVRCVFVLDNRSCLGCCRGVKGGKVACL